MRLGLQRAGWSIAFTNDIDQQKFEMYKGNFPDAEGHYIVQDIHQVSADEVPAVCLATASFPCNDLSLAGARDGLCGKHSSSFWGFIKILEEMRGSKPALVFLENVTGFLTSHKGNDCCAALLALNRLGYAVDAFILDAVNFVPQSRPRLFIVGVSGEKEAVGSSRLPALLKSEIRPKGMAEFICTHPEIQWRIRNLPSPTGTSSTLVDVLEDFPKDAPQWWSNERAEYLLNQMSPKHRQIAEGMIKKGNWSYGTVFRRIRTTQEGNKLVKKSMAEIRTDGIAGCLRTPRGGSGRQILFKAGYGKYFARLLTPRECARLMGADDYNITVPLNQALFGFGDAVCVPVIQWIAEQYLNPLVDELVRSRASLQPA